MMYNKKKSTKVVALKTGSFNVYSCSMTYNAPDASGQTAYCITTFTVVKGQEYVGPEYFFKAFEIDNYREFERWFEVIEYYTYSYPHEEGTVFLPLEEKYKGLPEPKVILPV
jgi:hypothetical protein